LDAISFTWSSEWTSVHGAMLRETTQALLNQELRLEFGHAVADIREATEFFLTHPEQSAELTERIRRCLVRTLEQLSKAGFSPSQDPDSYFLFLVAKAFGSKDPELNLPSMRGHGCCC
jgi:hypothetical protein